MWASAILRWTTKTPAGSEQEVNTTVGGTSIISRVRCQLAGVAAVLVLTTSCSADTELSEPRPTVPAVTVADEAAPIDAPTDAPPDEVASDGDSSQTGQDAPSGIAPEALPGDGNVLDAAIALEHVLTLDEPIDMTTASGDELPWIAQRGGQVLRVDLNSGEVVETILDISAETVAQGEQGLLGIAVSDDWLYANFTDLDGTTRIDAFKRDGNSLSGERRTILTQPQPFRNHNGGDLAIGPDGALYIALGDGGAANDPLDHGQNAATWLGSILRITPTPDAAEPYSVPADNPFASARGTDDNQSDQNDETMGSPEIFLTGVRNPWRISFDSATGDLWIADVGQDLYEEVTVLLAANGGGAGANLGWRLREGLHTFTGDKPPGNVDPVWEYGRDEGCSVTGGFVYRGSAIPELVGSYLFGDYCTARLWAVQISSGQVLFRDFGVAVPGGALASFAQDADGELYAMSLQGPVSRVVGS